MDDAERVLLIQQCERRLLNQSDHFAKLHRKNKRLIKERDALARTLATLAAAGIVVGEDGAVRWHGLTGAEIEARAGVTEAAQRFRTAHDAWSHRFMPQPGDTRGDEAERAQAALFAAVDALAAAAGRGADGEAGE